MTQETCGTVLIIEDDPGVARLQQRRLERAGYNVLVAHTAAGGMRQVRQGGVELIVLDYQLPDLNGLEVYERMKRAGQDVPVILVTGLSDEKIVIQSLRAGVRDFVTKSVEYLDYLPEAVGRVLKQLRLERRLGESEARLAGIIDSAMDAIITADADQHITLFNASAERIFQYSAAQALGRPLDVFIPAARNAGAGLFGRAAGAGLRAASFELRGLRASGEEFPLEASVSFAELERRNFCVIIVRDVTERQRAEELVREQAALLNKATNAIFVLDLENHIRYWNPGAERLYGWTAAQAVGQDAHLLLFKGVTPALEVARRAVAAKGEWSGELRQVRKDAKEVIVESHWTLLRDEEGRAKSMLVFNTDTTEQKKLEAQLLRAQRMESLAALAGGIAHDLNNVLTPILLAFELLDTALPAEMRKSLLPPLRASAERGADLVKQVLLFARAVEGQRIELEPRHVVRDLEKMLQNTLPKSIHFCSCLASDLWTVSGDATQLSQVLTNLCVNALEAMPQGGQLTISADNRLLDEHDARLHSQATPGPHVLLKVTDTGAGIPAEILDKIFDPFFTTKAASKRTGIGLSTALGIVRSHGGFIDVSSEVGQGSEFAVYLPAVGATQPRRAEAPKPELPASTGETILVVDDEGSIRAITRATLEAHGYRVLTASNGTDAVALYVEHRERIQAVLTDMMMPVMDGVATIRTLRKIDPHVSIVAVSGLTTAGQSAELQVIGAQAFLRKPYTADKLLTVLREVLDQRRGPDHRSLKTIPNLSEDERAGVGLASCVGLP